MVKTILVALDGSELAEQAIPAVSSLATAAKADVVLATIVVQPDRWPSSTMPRESIGDERDYAEFYLSSVVDTLRVKAVKARVRVEVGRAAETLVAIADEEAADLIAMTTHGRSGFTRWILGSVADRVLHLSRKPVLLIHAQPDGQVKALEFKRILVPLDGSATAESVLPFVKRLAADTKASLVLEGVIVPTAALYAGTFVPSSPPALQEIEAGSREYLGDVAAKIKQERFSVTTRVDVGYAAETILEAASVTGADLIALCTHGRSGPERWIRGSVADAIVRHADRPCLVLPAPHARHHADEPDVDALAIPIVGNTVVPPPTIVESVIPEAPRVRAPAERQHRPERSPGR
jgi:nucleotide-binding universal stress UspA family protein